MNPDIAFRQLTEAQHGLLLRAQARALGLTRHELDHRVERGILERVTPTILRVAGAPQTELQRALAAVYEAGFSACISHDSAAALWGLSGFHLEPFHTWRVRNRSTHPNRLATQHVTRMIPKDHVVRLHNVPVTTPTRLIFDQAARLSPGRVARLLDNAWAERLTSWNRLDRMLRQLARRGRGGIRVMRILLDERGPDYVAPASGLERRFMRLLAENGKAEYRRQVDLGDDDRWIGRTDFIHPSYPLIVEIQSDRFHTALLDLHADGMRIEAFIRAGYEVLELTEFEVWYRPQEMLEKLTSAEQRAAGRLRPLAA